MLNGAAPSLFDAGFTALSRAYEQDIKRVLGSRSPCYLFVTHAHFDHVGAASYLKKLWPEMKVVGSARTKQILSRPKAIELIRDLNQKTVDLLRPMVGDAVYEKPFQSFDIDIVLEPGQIIQLDSNCHIEPIHTPGHTWDFMSYWVPEKKILVASEAVGCEDGSGYIFTEFLVDYDAYRKSLQALARLDAQVLCQGHGLVFTGRDVKKHTTLSLEQADRYVAMVEETLRKEKGDIEKAVAHVKALEWDSRPWPKQPEPAYILNTQARVSRVWEKMQKFD